MSLISSSRGYGITERALILMPISNYNTGSSWYSKTLYYSPASLSVTATCDDNGVGLHTLGLALDLYRRAVLYINRPLLGAEASEQGKFPAAPTSISLGRSEPRKLV